MTLSSHSMLRQHGAHIAHPDGAVALYAFRQLIRVDDGVVDGACV